MRKKAIKLKYHLLWNILPILVVARRYMCHTSYLLLPVFYSNIDTPLNSWTFLHLRRSESSPLVTNTMNFGWKPLFFHFCEQLQNFCEQLQNVRKSLAHHIHGTLSSITWRIYFSFLKKEKKSRCHKVTWVSLCTMCNDRAEIEAIHFGTVQPHTSTSRLDSGCRHWFVI